MKNKLNDWDKFKAILWKNVTAQMNRKMELFVTILTALIFMPVIVIIRIINIPEMQHHTVYPAVSITDLSSFDEQISSVSKDSIPKRMLLYSPKNNVLENIISDAVNKLGLDGFTGYKTQEDMDKDLFNYNYLAGIAFNDDYGNIINLPKNLTYQIKMKSILRTNQNLRHPKTWTTDKLFPGAAEDINGPRNKKTSEDGLPSGYIQEGFIAIQHAVAMAFLEKSSGKTFGKIDIRRFAYPRYLHDPLERIIKALLPMCVVFVYMYPCHYIVKLITIERERDLKANMQIMGIRNYIHWTAWFLQLFVTQGIVTVLTTFSLSYTWYSNVSIYLYSDWTPILFFMMFYTISNITFTFALAAIFTKATTANLYASILHLSTYSVYIFSELFYDDIPFWGKLICCMFLNTGLAMGQMIILDFESTGEGLQWDKIEIPHSPKDELCLWHVMVMLLVAAVIHMIICLYVEKINPGQHGIAQPWYFPFKCSYWRKACLTFLFLPRSMMPRHSTYYDIESSTDDEHQRQQRQPRQQSNQTRLSEGTQSTLSEDEAEEERQRTRLATERTAATQSTLTEDEAEDDRLLAAERAAEERVRAAERAADERIRAVELAAEKRIRDAEAAARQQREPVTPKEQRISEPSIAPPSQATPNMRTVSIQTSFSLSEVPIEKPPPEKPPIDIIYNEPLKDPSVGIQLIDVNKKYGREWVIKDFSINCHRDEVTVIMGKPKSGKTSLVKMIIGSYEMTSGRIFINGNNIQKDLKAARTDLGIQPAHNIIFDDLTPSQHLHFYCHLRGVPRGKTMRKEIKTYLLMMAMYDLADLPAKMLTEGMARRLSLCCAFCGGTTSIICDELSQNLDMRSKQRLWKLIKTQKIGRTIVVTTQSEEEAMVIGDRIAVLFDGRLKCFNTSSALKAGFLSDYYMSCVKSNQQCDTQSVVTLLREHVKEIQLLNENTQEFLLKIPGNRKTRYPKMLKELDSKTKTLYVKNYLLRTLELSDVFMRVNPAKSNIIGSTEPTNSTNINSGRLTTNSQTGNKKQKWRAIYYQKCRYHRRNWWMFFLVILVPAISVATQVFFAKGAIQDINLPSLPIEMDMYSKALLALKIDRTLEDDSFEAKVYKEYENYAKSLGSEFRLKIVNYKRSMDKFILNEASHSVLEMENEFLAALEIGPDSYQALWNNQHYHTTALSLTLLHNALAKAAIGSDVEIHVVNDPIDYTPSEHLYLLKINSGLNIGLANNVVIAFCFVMAIIAVPIINDRLNGTKTLQFMSGVTMPTYWLTQFLWDYGQYTLTVLFTIFVFWVLKIPNYSSGPALIRIFVVMMIFGLCGIPFTYMRIFLFKNAKVAFLVIFVQGVIMSVMIVLLLVAFEVRRYIEKAEDYYPFFRIFSMINLFMALKNLHIGNEMRLVCDDLLKRDPKCETAPDCCTIPGYFTWDYPGVLRDIVNMLILGFVFAVITLLMDSDWWRYVMRKTLHRPKAPQTNNEPVDDNVLTENKNTLALDDEKMKEIPLVVKEAYRKRKNEIIRSISFTVPKDDCFCLLGIQNSGKNFLVELITGKYYFKWGDGYYKGHSITKDRPNAYGNIGYCPKKSALYNDLTAREIIRFFCMLKGMPKHHINEMIEQLSDVLKLNDIIDKRTREYKCSDKRKVSVAIAMIGRPTIMIVAEPTTSTDGETCAIIWNVLTKIRDDPDNSSILVTTDNIEEAEILSSRMAILVDGKLECIGLLSHLNTKFSNTYTLFIKESKEGIARRTTDFFDEESFTSDANSLEMEIKEKTPEELNRSPKVNSYEPDPNGKNWSELAAKYISIKTFFSKEVPEAKLNNEYDNCIIYKIPLKLMLWWEIFDMMESIKEPYLLEDYVLTQSRLEDIYKEFNMITDIQGRIKQDRPSFLKRLWRRIRRK